MIVTRENVILQKKIAVAQTLSKLKKDLGDPEAAETVCRLIANMLDLYDYERN